MMTGPEPRMRMERGREVPPTPSLPPGARAAAGATGSTATAELQRTDVTEEALEHIGCNERPGGAFGVVLHGLDGQAMVAQALDRAVVEVALADVEARGRRQRVSDDLDLMILCRDRDATIAFIAYRVVGGVVAEAQ